MENPSEDKRHLSKILFRYFGFEFFIPLFSCLTGFIGLFVIMDLLNDLDDFLDTPVDITFGQIARYFLELQPANLVQVLPMSILLAAGYMINALGRNNELTAVRASGISLKKACLPLWITAAILAVCSFFLNEFVVPDSLAHAEAWKDAIDEGKTEVIVEENSLLFTNKEGTRHWFFEKFSSTENGDSQKNIIIKQFRPDSTMEWKLRAAGIDYDKTAKNWIFKNAVITTFDKQGRLPEEGERPEHLPIFKPAGWGETPEQISNHLEPAQNLSITEIFRLLQNNESLPKKVRKTFHISIWQRISSPFSCITAILLGVSFSIAQGRSSTLRGFSIAVGLVVLYYFIGSLTVTLTELTPLPAATIMLPAIGFMVYGGWRLRNQ